MIEMKICPMCDCSCPYCVEKQDGYGDYDFYCELKHPERECDDYAYAMGEEA